MSDGEKWKRETESEGLGLKCQVSELLPSVYLWIPEAVKRGYMELFNGYKPRTTIGTGHGMREACRHVGKKNKKKAQVRLIILLCQLEVTSSGQA